jgi:hypothetical protein
LPAAAVLLVPLTLLLLLGAGVQVQAPLLLHLAPPAHPKHLPSFQR